MQQFLAALPLLACPVAMGTMIWWMSRNRHSADADQAPDQTADVARLRAELDELRAAHEARSAAVEQNAGGNP